MFLKKKVARISFVAKKPNFTITYQHHTMLLMWIAFEFYSIPKQTSNNIDDEIVFDLKRKNKIFF